MRCGTRRWDHLKSAIFTTVHSGARRTSELETNLSFSWRKFVTSSVFFHRDKYRETRVRNKCKFVSKTEIKSRPGKQANQDSPWKAKRAKFSLKSELRSRSTNFKPSLTEEVSRNQLELLSLFEWKLIILLQEVSNPGEITYCWNKKYPSKIGIFVKLVSGICETCKNSRKVTCWRSRIFREKFDRRLWGSKFVLPGLECQDSVHPWRRQSEVPRCWDWRRAHQEFAGITTVPSSGARSKWDNCQIRIIVWKTMEQLLAEAKSEYRANLAENNICELVIHIDSQAVEFGHIRTGYEQFRREQALFHEELADRERAFRDTRIWSIQKLEELKRAGISTRIFNKKVCRKSFQRCRICSQRTIIWRSQSTSVISSSSWTRRTAEPRLRLAAHGKSGNFFGWSTCVFSRNAQFKGFLCYGKFSSASKYGETRNRKWWWRSQPILSQDGSYPKQPGETIDWNSNALPEGVYLENCRVKKSQVSAERWKEKIGGKAREEGPCAVHLKTISTSVLAWMVVAQFHLLVNSAKKVCLDAPSDWWTVKPKLKVTKIQWQRLNIHDNWLRMLQDDEPPKSSWRPRTNTVVRPIKRAKIHESHTVTEKGPSHGKIGPSLVAWMACSKIRDAPAEKSRESKAQTSPTRTEMLFLWCFSAPYWENFSSLRSTLHNFKPYLRKRMELVTPTKQR